MLMDNLNVVMWCHPKHCVAYILYLLKQTVKEKEAVLFISLDVMDDCKNYITLLTFHYKTNPI